MTDQPPVGFHPSIDLRLEGDGCWADLAGAADRIIHTTHLSLAALAQGMTSGKPSVLFRFDLEDGRTVMAETSLVALLTAVDAIVARHGDPR